VLGSLPTGKAPWAGQIDRLTLTRYCGHELWMPVCWQANRQLRLRVALYTCLACVACVITYLLTYLHGLGITQAPRR
jgi:hypothetical protein